MKAVGHVGMVNYKGFKAWGKSTTRSIDDVVIAGDIALANSSPNQRLIVSGGDIAHSLGNPPNKHP